MFWTLCYEVQFYLPFIALYGVAQHVGDRWQLGEGGRMWVRLLAFAPLTMWSLGPAIEPEDFLKNVMGTFLGSIPESLAWDA